MAKNVDSNWNDWYRSYGPRAHCFLLAFTGNHDRSVHLSQELWQTLLSDAHQIHPRVAFMNYVYRRANRLLDEYIAAIDSDEAVGSERAHADEHMVFMRFLQVLRNLGDAERHAVYLSSFSDLPLAQQQSILGVSKDDHEKLLEKARVKHGLGKRQLSKLRTHARPRIIDLRRVEHGVGWAQPQKKSSLGAKPFTHESDSFFQVMHWTKFGAVLSAVVGVVILIGA